MKWELESTAVTIVLLFLSNVAIFSVKNKNKSAYLVYPPHCVTTRGYGARLLRLLCWFSMRKDCFDQSHICASIWFKEASPNILSICRTLVVDNLWCQHHMIILRCLLVLPSSRKCGVFAYPLFLSHGDDFTSQHCSSLNWWCLKQCASFVTQGRTLSALLNSQLYGTGYWSPLVHLKDWHIRIFPNKMEDPSIGLQMN